MNEADFAKAAGKVMGDTFAQTSAVLRRCRDVTHRLAKLNDDGYRQNRKGELYWRLVVAVPVSTLDLSDDELARSMIRSAIELLGDRLEALEPDDGVERIAPSESRRPAFGAPIAYSAAIHSGRPRDLRTKEGRAWRMAQRAGATA